MKILYIFPHPDDESFGPAGVIDQQLKEGHNVYLLTLTRGGATKQRFRLGKSIDEMGEIRLNEMKDVERTLGLTGMEVLDLPDGRLKEMDPREIESVIAAHIRSVQPDVVVTYAVHGISGFHDHLVTHAVVKRVFVELKEKGDTSLKRLALLTMPDNGKPVFGEGDDVRMKLSDEEDIDCIVTLTKENTEMFIECLNCYKTYQETIKQSRVVEKIGDKVYFEFFQEQYETPVDKLTTGL